MQKKDVAATRKLGKESQISYRSHPDIVSALDLAAAKLATIDRYDGSKVRTGHLANALALWVSTLELDEIRAKISPMLRSLERYMEGGVEVTTPRSVQGTVVGSQKARKLA